jgi:hypothetical protein
MTRILRMICVLLAVTAVPVVVGAQKVTYDFRKATNFAEVKSFAIQTGQLSDNPLVNERIINDLTGELTVLGLKRTANPDVYFVPSMSTEMRKEVTTYTSAYGYGYSGYYGAYGWHDPYGAYGWGPISHEIRDVRYDTLRIDMIDAKTGELLWRGQGVKRVNPGWKPEKVDRKVNQLVTKVLANFPPGRDDD